MLTFETETLQWLFICFETIVGCLLVLGSKSQPFPQPSRRFGLLILGFTATIALGQYAPQPVTVTGHLFFLTGMGTFGLLAGINHLVRTRREVLIAPFSGFFFCVGVSGLMVQTWDSLNQFEQWAGFFSLVVLAAGQTWLVFRGLLIGRLPLAWSQAGMVALQRGNISGESGAIACFEKGWDAEEEHLNPMAYLALHRLHLFVGDEKSAREWYDALLDVGGEQAVAFEWIEAIHASLLDVDPVAWENLPKIVSKEQE
ncbi:MAG: hypothetical protein CMA72_04145 [Euryarchaeota archaeon]|jgi:hypothetical protein|nr:hypothetical protein [Euryarchaeota archaeon]|tara:strand:- start:713 stop:1483 length:771 start_codon:yes stop_codon:yes gene_type:complete